MSDTVRVTFRFALGGRVRWAELPGICYQVCERHYREGTVSRFVRYRITGAPQGMPDQLAYEPDLAHWEES